ncbi:hypothetical protein SAMN05216238_105158 [Lentibacillus persicus]|uniref:Uncharacterized protein n=1 Tax=Lentibacillus persicus TaxID=640948 RepID=A0A1I1W7L4_9BACI|nr:hypothetical protein [Lentibacillus persicus]SFD89000.1 hypothetical protein SAMN05216238_105158 [Lentibacillus persicus]
MKSKSRWSDPGIILVAILLVISAIVLIWWPTDIYFMGITLAGWLMFFSYFVWFALSIIYVVWMEKRDAKNGG